MKKMFFISLAFCLGLGMMSCGNNAKAGAAADSTATEEVKAEAPAKKVDINELVAKAKAEGANWDEAQWKAAYEDMFTAMEPMIKMARDMEEKPKLQRLKTRR